MELEESIIVIVAFAASALLLSGIYIFIKNLVSLFESISGREPDDIESRYMFSSYRHSLRQVWGMRSRIMIQIVIAIFLFAADQLIQRPFMIIMRIFFNRGGFQY